MSLDLSNPLLNVDSYKYSHYLQFPEGTKGMFYYLESRGGVYDETLFFGLQYILESQLLRPITMKDIGEAELFVNAHGLPFNRKGFERLVEKHGGKWPVKIRAAREGSVIPTHNVLVTVENTDPEFFWVPSFIETLLMRIWYPITVATQSYNCKKVIKHYLDLSADFPDRELAFKLHDFGSRGVSSRESAGIGGMAHLVNFMGSDTVDGVAFANHYYDEPMSAFSIPAAEHSTITSWGGKEGEIEAFRNMLNQFADTDSILAVVSDSYDIYNAVENYWGTQLRQQVIDSGATLVVRPDCYSEDTMILTNSGWKLFSELDPSDLVAQVKEDLTYEFVKPIKYVAQDYQGKMIHFKDGKGKLDLLVTPNHRMIFRQKGRTIVQEASECFVGNWNKTILRSARSQSLGRTLSSIDRLKIAFQADGSFHSKGGNIRFSFSKQRKMDRLESLLESADIRYKKYNLSDGRSEYNVWIDASMFQKDFDWVDTSDLCSDWCREFIEELSYWDATRRSEDRFKFDTGIKKVADKVELIAMSAGYGVLRSEHKDTRKDYYVNLHTMHILKDNRIGGQSMSKSEIDYDGKVYCVQVPSGMLVVKRNRCTSVCGNSGHPPEVVVKCLQLLDKTFGSTINSKGYKVLNHVRVIQGDGINQTSIDEILQRTLEAGFSATCVTFGMGGALLQQVNRDTQKFAFKCSAIQNSDGKWVDVWKDPITDPGKTSKKGRLHLVHDPEIGYFTVKEAEPFNSVTEDTTVPFDDVFLNGEILRKQTLKDVRSRANREL